MAVGENGIRIFFTVPDVCENDTGNGFLIGQSHAHVGLVIKHAPSPTNNITTGVISEFFFFFGVFFAAPTPAFSMFSMSKIWRNLTKNWQKLLVEIYTRKTKK